MPRIGLAVAGLVLLLTACSTTDTNLQRTVARQIPAPTAITADMAFLRIRTLAPVGPIPSLPPVCGSNAPHARLIAGEHGIVSEDDPRPLNVRSAPGINHDIVGRLEIRDVFMVLDGPQCHGEYVWYYIERGNLQGWIAEGEFSLYYVAPYFPG